VLGSAGPLARIEQPVRVHLSLESAQEGRPGRCGVGGGVGEPGVQVVGGYARPQCPLSR
jgi:hypothetical protein